MRTLSVDLKKPDALDRVRTVTDDVEVGLLIYYASRPGSNVAPSDVPSEVA